MPEPRICDVVGTGADMPHTPSSAVKASGDSMACNICPHQEIFRSSSKHKTPRSVRYDLENALVGLCDVWFGEIKPYLVRNNIKLHVNCSSAGGDQQPPTTRSTDPSSRYDPGAGPDVQSHNNEQKQVRQPCIHRRRRRRAQPEPNWRVPRLCRTFSALCQAGVERGSHAAKSISYSPAPLPQPQPPRDDFYRFIVPRRKFVMKNKGTQTEQASSVSKGCQSLRPHYFNRSPCRPSPRRPSPCRPSPRRAEPGHARAAGNNDSAPSPSILPPRIICRFKRPEAPAAEITPFIQNDLIDITAEGNEKRLKLLYSSSEKDDRDNPSFMNLIHSSLQEKPVITKLPPWR